jgi:hypothetical protein
MTLNVKRFCLMVLSDKKLSCSAEFLCVTINIRSVKAFERENMIYIVLIVRLYSKGSIRNHFFQYGLDIF